MRGQCYLMSSLAVRLRLVRAEHLVSSEVMVSVSPTASPTTLSRGQSTGALRYRVAVELVKLKLASQIPLGNLGRRFVVCLRRP